MSVLEELVGLEEKVRSRMAELHPLLAEYAELEQVAKRLGIDVAAGVSSDAPADAKTQAQVKRSSRRRRTSPKPARAKKTAAEDKPEAGASRGQSASKPKRSNPSSASPTASKSRRQPGGSRSGNRAEQVAALVAQNPGMTVKDVGAQVGADPTSLYRVVKQLQSAGKLEKRGRELHPA